jgi:plasmid stabilization system protein ParE
MEIYWTLKAQDDLERIYRFALQYSRQHADDVLDRLITVLVLQRIRQLAYSRLV